jgi:hypothetical protein
MIGGEDVANRQSAACWGKRADTIAGSGRLALTLRPRDERDERTPPPATGRAVVFFVATFVMADGRMIGLKPTLAACTSLLAASAIVAPAVAQVADADPTGIEVGARIGYGRALGSRVEGARLEDTWDGAWPLALDIGYRLTPHLYLGGTLIYMPLQLDKTHLGCNTELVDGPGDCSGSAARLAFDAQWLLARSWYATWIAAGFGVERMTINYRSGCLDGPFSTEDTGVEFGHLEIGIGARLQPGLVIGPFVQYAAGMFLASTISGSCRRGGSDIPDKAVHGSVLWGLRVTYTVR